MGIWQWINGMIRLEMISADIPRTITRCSEAGIELHHTKQIDPLTLHFSVRRKDFTKMKGFVASCGAELKVLQRSGLYWSVSGLRKRPVLVIGMLLLLATAFFLPKKVLFVRVEGNSYIPQRMILEKASQCGIYFGADREAVRSERMKNALLEAMPQLQWAGVNTAGCVAVITVRERKPEEKAEDEYGVSSIIAVRDGIIDSCVITRGTALCKVGQAVTQGQTLISGYTDCGITIRAEAAKGEIYALTEHKISVCALCTCMQQGDVQSTERVYSLKIGKKRINFGKDSGISDATCDRIYLEKYITLPGGFILPVALVTEKRTYYRCAQSETPEQPAQLSDYARKYLQEQMIAGNILSGTETTNCCDSVLLLDGTYQCREMIGRVIQEEIMKPNGNDK